MVHADSETDVPPNGQLGSAEDIRVGTKLWYVPTRGSPCEMTVTRVGRKWVHLGGENHWDGRRADKQTLEADGKGYSSPGRFYLSEADWRRQCERLYVWQALNWHIREGYGRLDASVTESDIREAARLLKIELPETKEG